MAQDLISPGFLSQAARPSRSESILSPPVLGSEGTAPKVVKPKNRAPLQRLRSAAWKEDAYLGVRNLVLVLPLTLPRCVTFLHSEPRFPHL